LDDMQEAGLLSEASKAAAANQVAEKAFQQVDPEDREAARQEECSTAVAGASWLKRRTCDCGENMAVVCPGEPCNSHERKFKAKIFMKKEGCQCKTCDTSCESVPGASRRPALARMWGRDCACEKGWKLSGSDAACQKSSRKGQYFRSKHVVGLGCACSEESGQEGEVIEEETEEEDEEVNAADAEPAEEETEEENPEEEQPEEEQPEEEQPEEEQPEEGQPDGHVRMLPVNHSDTKEAEEEEIAPPSASNLLEDLKKPDVGKAVAFGVGVLVLGGGCVTLIVCAFRGGNGDAIHDEDH